MPEKSRAQTRLKINRSETVFFYVWADKQCTKTFLNDEGCGRTPISQLFGCSGFSCQSQQTKTSATGNLIKNNKIKINKKSPKPKCYVMTTTLRPLHLHPVASFNKRDVVECRRSPHRIAPTVISLIRSTSATAGSSTTSTTTSRTGMWCTTFSSPGCAHFLFNVSQNQGGL